MLFSAIARMISVESRAGGAAPGRGELLLPAAFARGRPAWPLGIASVAASEFAWELLGSSPIASTPCCSVGTPEPGLLPFTGVTRLPRYYEPLRHPFGPDALGVCSPR